MSVIEWDGTPAILSTVLDNSERKQAEDAFRKSEALLSKAQAIAHIGSFEWDVTRDEIVWSDEMLRIYGIGRNDFGGSIGDVMPLIHPDDRGRIQEGIERALKEGTDEGLEYRIVRPDGSIRTLFARAEFADGTSEAFPILIGFVQDITERKQAGEALRQREEELTHVARLSTLGEMVAGIAHELGQPLYAIANYTDACTSELMSRQFEASDKLPEWIEGIDEAVKRASTVVKQLKQFASRGGMAPRRLQVDRDQLGLDEVIAESIELLNFELRRNNVKVALEPKSDGRGLEVNVERIPIQQVLVNLVRNASDAMMETPETDRRVVIHVFDRGDTAEIAVEDRGTGISEHNAERVFDAFFTTKAAGMGMGLAISRRIDL